MTQNEVEGAASIAEVLTISGLMRRTGMSRSAIHFYLREGLLPQPQKTAVNRSLYTEDHIGLLHKIAELKASGHTLTEIKAAVRDDVARAAGADVDLAGQQNERVRQAILRVATEEFMRNGYRQTRVATIIRKAGVTSQAFYSQFPSKSQLLVESFRTFMEWNLAFFEPKLADRADVGERVLWRLHADFLANQLGSEVLSLVQSEPAEGTDLALHVEQAWEPVVRRVTAEWESMRRPGSPPPVSLELLAYSLIGALHNAALRTTWDDKYDRADLLGAHLWLYLALLAAMSGEVDIDSRLAQYKDLIREIAAREPESPPVPED
jgi:AcrR family transcriptional regulator/predicted DNA-binding transcriptional regulator AlpA